MASCECTKAETTVARPPGKMQIRPLAGRWAFKLTGVKHPATEGTVCFTARRRLGGKTVRLPPRVAGAPLLRDEREPPLSSGQSPKAGQSDGTRGCSLHLIGQADPVTAGGWQPSGEIQVVSSTAATSRSHQPYPCVTLPPRDGAADK